jgi:hypothetical protein
MNEFEENLRAALLFAVRNMGGKPLVVYNSRKSTWHAERHEITEADIPNIRFRIGSHFVSFWQNKKCLTIINMDRASQLDRIGRAYRTGEASISQITVSIAIDDIIQPYGIKRLTAQGNFLKVIAALQSQSS